MLTFPISMLITFLMYLLTKSCRFFRTLQASFRADSYWLMRSNLGLEMPPPALPPGPTLTHSHHTPGPRSTPCPSPQHGGWMPGWLKHSCWGVTASAEHCQGFIQVSTPWINLHMGTLSMDTVQGHFSAIGSLLLLTYMELFLVFYEVVDRGSIHKWQTWSPTLWEQM